MASSDFTRINTNIGALNALNSLKNVQRQLGDAQLKLSTGKNINSAADDPAGLTIATKFNYTASGLGVAVNNIDDGKNLLAVAEGGLSNISTILQQMRDKAEQAASDTLGTDERTAIQGQLNDFASEINDIVATTQWNGNKLLDGLQAFSGGGGINFQAGVGTTSNDRIVLQQGSFGAVDTNGLSIGTTVTATSTSADSGAIVSSLATAATVGTVQQLTTGSYTMKVVIGSRSGGTADSYAQLVDGAGNPLTVDANGDGVAGLVDNKVTFAYNTGGTNTVNFGNGLSVTLATSLAAGVQTNATVAYSQSGSYNGNVSTAAGARSAVDASTAAISTVSNRLQTVGTYTSRMDFREQTLTVAQTNNEAAYSRIMDADMASEQLQATKLGILQQTATAMLSQANSAPQGILSLFR